MLAAFGIFAAVLESGGQFDKVRGKALNMAEYVDSITVDGHKLLNVVDILLSCSSQRAV